MQVKDFVSKEWEIWVLAPTLKTDDETLQYYCDYSQSIVEYTKAFKELGLEWTWQEVRIDNYPQIVDRIAAQPNAHKIIVLNLCDGDEINNVPGISVLRHLEGSSLIFTGAREAFYDATTSKIEMKKAFDRHGVSTASWIIVEDTPQSVAAAFGNVKSPLIVKPAISAGSMGISTKSVVQDAAELSQQIQVLKSGCHGWNTAQGGIFVERFVAGREFTTLIVGNASDPGHAIVYRPVERVFDASLKKLERFLSFDRLWEFYKDETPMPAEAPFYVYAQLEGELCEKVKALSWKAYESVNGTGYARVDLRMCEETSELFVLEVNAQCGISEDENFTSVGAILRFEKKSFCDLVAQVLINAVQQARCKKESVAHENLCAST